MKKLSVLIVPLLLLTLTLGTIGCGGGGEPATTPTPKPAASSVEGYLTYEDEMDGFSISHPEDWEIAPEQLFPDAIVAFWALEACSEFVTNFNLINEELPSPISVETYFEAGKRHLRNLEGYTPISEKALTINSVPAIKQVCTWEPEGETIQLMQVCLVDDTTAWILSFTTVPACWDQYETTFDAMAETFQVLD
jgi:hypothetical protein